MKILKSILAFGLLFSATLTANAYDYPLLNDMKMAKQEQLLLNNMRALIDDRKNNNKSELNQHKKVFTKIITGLLKGDKELKLHGTELVSLQNKIKTIQLLWSQEKGILDSALNSKMYVNDAYETIDRLSTHISSLNKLYKQSYDKYKQNSSMKSLVSSYMKRDNRVITEPMYALNVVK